MNLYAHRLTFNHPITNERISLDAKVNEEFTKVANILGLDISKYS